MVPEKVLKEPRPLSSASANPWGALQREVQVDIGDWDKKVEQTTESPVDGQDKPKIYEIRDHTLEVLMQPSVAELHAVRVVRTPHGDERQLHLKMRVMCGRKEVIADVLLDTGGQVGLVRNGLCLGTYLNSSDQPVRFKVANGGIMAEGSSEAELGLEFWEHDRLDRPDQAKFLMLHGKFYEADLPHWEIIMFSWLSIQPEHCHIVPHSSVWQRRGFLGYRPVLPLVDPNGRGVRRRKLFVR